MFQKEEEMVLNPAHLRLNSIAKSFLWHHMLLLRSVKRGRWVRQRGSREMVKHSQEASRISHLRRSGTETDGQWILFDMLMLCSCTLL